MFTLIRSERKKKKDGYHYSCPQYPELVAHTDYYEGIKKAVWRVDYQGTCILEQTNNYPRYLDYIPIVNALVTLFFYRKYDIFLDGQCVGYCDSIWVEKKFKTRIRFVVNAHSPL